MFPKSASDTLDGAPMWISTRAGQTPQSSGNKQCFGPLGSNLDAVGDCSCSQIKGTDIFRIQSDTNKHIKQVTGCKCTARIQEKALQVFKKFTALFLWHSKVSQTLFSRDRREFTISCCLLMTALRPGISWRVVNILFIHWVNNVYFLCL